MRIVSGKFKGKRFRAPKNLPSRPTTDFAKEALFNILRNRLYIEECQILDLFAGIGSMSVEFMSRKAVSCLSVEQHFACVKFMNSLKRELQLSNWNILKTDVFKYLKSSPAQFDIIFADPPYELENLELLPNLIFDHEMLTSDGLFILEHGKNKDFSGHQYFQEVKNYGNVNFTFFY